MCSTERRKGEGCGEDEHNGDAQVYCTRRTGNGKDDEDERRTHKPPLLPSADPWSRTWKFPAIVAIA
jgi:hypothetical protein